MKRSKFSLSNYKVFSCNMGSLVPCGITEVLPGDTIQQTTSALVRCSPLIAPVMHPVHCRIHHWYVPHRLVWDDFEKFITGGPDGDDASEFPTIDVGGSGVAVGSLGDYLGVPTGVADLVVSALPFRAYDLIWNEHYRDQDLETELVVDTTSGADTTTEVDLQQCAWEKDYFTSARPWEQKGADVTVPIGDSAPIAGFGIKTDVSAAASASSFMDGIGTTFGTGGPVWEMQDAGNLFAVPAQTTGVPNASTNLPQIYADLSAVSGISINALREAFAMQRFKEMRARYGSRYVEYLRALGVRSSDARLARPEYLGGGRQTIQFSEVLQTGVTTSGTDLGVGELKGHGIGAMRSNRYRRFIEEHGYVISLLSVKPKTMYFQGLARHWNRRTKEDFWQRELQHIGQQAILNKELYAAHTTPEGTFGYQDRYDEYRRSESTIGGEFRSSTLNHWHFAREFSSDPSLNASFVSCVPTERTFAVPSEDVLWIMANHSIQARRLVAQTGRSFIF